MPNYMNTFTGGAYMQPQGGIGQLVPQQPGQANQPKLGQASSQLGVAVGLNQQPQQFQQPMAAPQQQMPAGFSATNMAPQPMAQAPQSYANFNKTSVLGFAGGGLMPSAGKDALVKEAQMAVQGRHPNSREAIANFESVMGQDATNDLIRAHATGGRIRGSGGGVDDLVPGSIDGREDVRLASGEYVIPARVVSALGDGDTDRGSQILDEFVARVRAAASEAMMGSEPIDAQSLLPEV